MGPSICAELKVEQDSPIALNNEYHYSEDMQRHSVSWETNPLFQDLSPEEIAIVGNWVTGKSFNSNEYLIREGEPGTQVYVILQGRVEILKHGHTESNEYRVNVLEEGAIVGEIVFFGKDVRTASVRALSPVDTIEFELGNLKKEHPDIALKILANFASHFAARLEETTNEMVIVQKKKFLHEKKLNAMGILTLRIFIILLLYQTTVSSFLFFSHFKTNSIFMFMEMPLILIFSYYCFRVIKKSEYPLSSYGLTLHDWKKSLFESMIVTLSFMFLIVVVKWVIVETVASYEGAKVFGFGIKTYGVPIKKSIWKWWDAPEIPLTLAKIAMIFYIISTPLQEFVIRGVVQTSLQRCLSGRNRTLLAVVISNLFFAILHQPLHWLMPFMAFIPGLLWGWLFARHRTLLGVSLSHLIIGFWAFYIVGFEY